MYRTILASTLLLASTSLAQTSLSENAIESEILAVETQLDSLVPGGIPSKTAIAEDLASFVTSVTAQPEFSNALSVLETAVPSSVVSELQADPEALVLSLATATSPPAWIEAIPTSVIDYLSSIGEEAVSLVEENLPTSLVGGSGYTAPYATGAAAATGGYAMPTGSNSTAPTAGNASPAPFIGNSGVSLRSSAIAVMAGIAGVGLLYVL